MVDRMEAAPEAIETFSDFCDVSSLEAAAIELRVSDMVGRSESVGVGSDPDNLDR